MNEWEKMFKVLGISSVAHAFSYTTLRLKKAEREIELHLARACLGKHHSVQIKRGVVHQSDSTWYVTVIDCFSEILY